VLTVGVDTLPPLPKDAGDRNRTSPFAFTGNKFEFRAVGSSQSIAGPLVVLNTIVAESSTTWPPNSRRPPRATRQAERGRAEAAAEIIKEHKAVIFNGDGYSEAWHKEAEKRGLPNLRNTVDALAAMYDKEFAALFEKYGVLTKREFTAATTSTSSVLQGRQHRVQALPEHRQEADPARRLPLPGRTGHHRRRAEGAGKTPDTSSLDKITELVGGLESASPRCRRP
jgi:hypothetical protein